MREDERDRLRVLAENELRQLLRIGLLERREAGRGLERAQHAVHDPARAVGAKRAIEHAPRVVDVSARDVVGGDRDLMELVENFLAELRRHRTERRHLLGQPLDLVLGEVLEHFRRELLADEQHHDRGFPDSRGLLW